MLFSFDMSGLDGGGFQCIALDWTGFGEVYCGIGEGRRGINPLGP